MKTTGTAVSTQDVKPGIRDTDARFTPKLAAKRSAYCIEHTHIRFRFTSDSLQIQFNFNLLWKSLCPF
ncbi:hypothetical protein ACN38_g3856 [Penicillium nordicum]|uniref:Uncharacterized protein n=1 Tax=Penicillium nordicum TaxID=229535 RepID=A0A0M9WHM9_9EURO|nr:hypothetical protein ACN38_g3856 [Penicillium nordicum]